MVQDLWNTKTLNPMRILIPAVVLIAAFLLYRTSTEDSLNPDQVPAAVQQRLAVDFQNASTKWEPDSAGSLEAEFKMGWQKVTANYSPDGELLETESDIRKDALPAAILRDIAKRFPSHEIAEASLITYPDGRVVYEAELHGARNEIFDAIYSADGTQLERIELVSK
jgi:hypothetical protein